MPRPTVNEREEKAFVDPSKNIDRKEKKKQKDDCKAFYVTRKCNKLISTFFGGSFFYYKIILISDDNFA